MAHYQSLRPFIYLLFCVLLLVSCGGGSDSEYGGEPVQNSNPSYSSPDSSEPADTEFVVTNSGATSYVFNGGGFTNAGNPDIVLKRGATYTFTISSPGHPFNITETPGFSQSGIYNDGVDNNGIDSGTLTFEVPMDAPDLLYYICEFHSAMSGVFTIED